MVSIRNSFLVGVFLSLLFVGSGGVGYAQTVSDGSTAILLFLEYNDQTHKLSLRSSGLSPWIIARKPFISQIPVSQADYVGIVLNARGESLAEFGILLPKAERSGVSQSFEQLAPYFPNIALITIYQQGKELFTIDVSPAALCIEDGVCRQDVGETSTNCSRDCSQEISGSFESGPPPPFSKGRIEPVSVEGFPLSHDSEPLPIPDEYFGLPLRTLLAFGFFVLGALTFSVWMILRRRHGG